MSCSDEIEFSCKAWSTLRPRSKLLIVLEPPMVQTFPVRSACIRSVERNYLFRTAESKIPRSEILNVFCIFANGVHGGWEPTGTERAHHHPHISGEPQ